MTRVIDYLTYFQLLECDLLSSVLSFVNCSEPDAEHVIRCLQVLLDLPSLAE
jgi:hypothetical protein